MLQSSVCRGRFRLLLSLDEVAMQKRHQPKRHPIPNRIFTGSDFELASSVAKATQNFLVGVHLLTQPLDISQLENFEIVKEAYRNVSR
jgi:hypothetical protein